MTKRRYLPCLNVQMRHSPSPSFLPPFYGSQSSCGSSVVCSLSNIVLQLSFPFQTKSSGKVLTIYATCPQLLFLQALGHPPCLLATVQFTSNIYFHNSIHITITNSGTCTASRHFECAECSWTSGWPQCLKVAVSRGTSCRDVQHIKKVPSTSIFQRGAECEPSQGLRVCVHGGSASRLLLE